MMDDQVWAGITDAMFVKFDLYCPMHPEIEMTSGGGDIEPGQKVVARCRICNHAVIMAVRYLDEDPRGESVR